MIEINDKSIDWSKPTLVVSKHYATILLTTNVGKNNFSGIVLRLPNQNGNYNIGDKWKNVPNKDYKLFTNDFLIRNTPSKGVDNHITFGIPTFEHLTTGNDDIAIGYQALNQYVTGNNSNFIGQRVLEKYTSNFINPFNPVGRVIDKNKREPSEEHYKTYLNKDIPIGDKPGNLGKVSGNWNSIMKDNNKPNLKRLIEKNRKERKEFLGKGIWQQIRDLGVTCPSVKEIDKALSKFKIKEPKVTNKKDLEIEDLPISEYYKRIIESTPLKFVDTREVKSEVYDLDTLPLNELLELAFKINSNEKDISPYLNEIINIRKEEQIRKELESKSITVIPMVSKETEEKANRLRKLAFEKDFKAKVNFLAFQEKFMEIAEKYGEEKVIPGYLMDMIDVPVDLKGGISYFHSMTNYYKTILKYLHNISEEGIDKSLEAQKHPSKSTIPNLAHMEQLIRNCSTEDKYALLGKLSEMVNTIEKT